MFFMWYFLILTQHPGENVKFYLAAQKVDPQDIVGDIWVFAVI